MQVPVDIRLLNQYLILSHGEKYLSHNQIALNSYMRTGQTELVNWAKQNFIEFEAVAAITFNLKQSRIIPGGYWPITPEIARHQITWLFKNLDRKVFGNRSKREGLKTVRFVSHELGNTDDHLHAHAAIGIPTADISPMKFLDEVDRLWKKANWGYGHGDIDLCEIQSKWISYILKHGQDALDLDNTWLPKSPR